MKLSSPELRAVRFKAQEEGQTLRTLQVKIPIHYKEAIAQQKELLIIRSLILKSL